MQENPSNRKPRLLVVCGKAKKRSRTAEAIFRDDDRLHVRAAGVSPKADRKLTEDDLRWADLILVMEGDHRARIREGYAHLNLPPVEVLDIPDEYEFMDAELVAMLTASIEDAITRF